MNANLLTKKIEMTKSEAKAAGKINSREFDELNDLRTAYPTFAIEVKVRATAKRKSDYKGLTYDYMESYINNHDDENKSIMAEYAMMRGTSAEAEDACAATCSYADIKKWFLSKYPAITEFHEKRKALLVA